MFQIAIAVIRVSSCMAARQFYCDRLGFTVLAEWRPGQTKEDPCYMTLARDGVRLHVQSFPSGGALGGGNVYVVVDDVDALLVELTSKGVALAGPPLDQDWGMREIGLRDADGNIITFGQKRSG